jgi:hypothetical protein
MAKNAAAFFGMIQEFYKAKVNHGYRYRQRT